MPETRESYNQTVPLEPAGSERPVAPALAGDASAPALPGAGASDQLARHGCPVGAGAGRYEVRELLGVGSTGRVWVAHDRDLDRAVAVKVLEPGPRTIDQDVRGFVEEARITAALQHPNVVPVHELGVTADGAPYFSMGRVSGRALGDLLRASTPAARDRLVAEPNAVVTIFIGILHALEYAHAQRIVHQDVKPDNILLGEFGEVLLLDWGSAARLGEDGSARSNLYGTPLYMSPEQARHERADRLSDVYCVGASLFHALTLREPTWSPDPEEFWRKKRAGEIDPPTPAEVAAVPAALLAIALKALARDPAGRYHSAATMRADLERYQAGQAVSARRESVLEALRRWYGRNRAHAWTAAVSTVVLIIVVLGLWIEKRKETARWTLVYDADQAASGDLARDWTCWSREMTEPSARELRDFSRYWKMSDGVLHGAFGMGFADLSFRRPMLGDLRVEWDYANLIRGADYNCFIDGPHRDAAYTFHVGGWGNPRYCRLSSGDPEDVCDENLDVPDMPAGTSHHFVLERVGATLRLEIDGATIISHHRTDGTGSRDGDTFGFDACYRSALAIAHLRVWHRPPAELISPLALGDKLLSRGDAAGARRQYEEIANSYGGDLGRAAVFKAAFATMRAGDENGGLARLDAAERDLPGDPMVPYALCERLRVAHARGDEAGAQSLLRRLAAYRGHPVLRSVFYDELQRSARALAAECAWATDRPYPVVDVVADVAAAHREAQRLAGEYGLRVPMVGFTTTVSQLLRDTDHSGFVVDTFVGDDRAQLMALRDLGRFDELVSRYRGHGFDEEIGAALLASGHLAEVAAGPYPREQVNDALRELGRPPLGEDAPDAALVPRDANLADQLMAEKRYDEVLARYPGSWRAIEALFTLKRYDEVLAATAEYGPAYQVATTWLVDGREPEGLALIDRLGKAAIPDQRDEQLILARFLLPVLIASDAGREQGQAALRELSERRRWTFSQRVWHIAEFASGEMGEVAFRQQPHRRWVTMYLRMAEAMRAALRHDGPAEIAAWRALAAMREPSCLGSCDMNIANWRLERYGVEPAIFAPRPAP